VINVTDVQANASNLPAYILSAEHTAKTDLNWTASKAFMNNDLLPANNKVKITFFNDGQDLDWDRLEVWLNGTKLSPGGSIYEQNKSSGNILIKDIGATSGTLLLMASSDGIQLENTMLDFRIDEGSFKITDFYGYPSPYDPAVADECNIGFTANDSGTAIIYIYDSTMRQVHKSEKQIISQGYNVYNWNVQNDAGKAIGSGAYLIMIVAKNSEGSQQIMKTKIGIK